MAGPTSFYAKFKEQAPQILDTVFTANIFCLLQCDTVHQAVTKNEWIKPVTIETVSYKVTVKLGAVTTMPLLVREPKKVHKKALQNWVGIIARAAGKLQDSFDTISGKLHSGVMLQKVTQDEDPQQASQPTITALVTKKPTNKTEFIPL